MKRFNLVYLGIGILLQCMVSCSETELDINNENEAVKASIINANDILVPNDANTSISDTKITYLSDKDEQDISKEIIEHINKHRKSIGLNNLVNNTTAKVYALSHSESQAISKKISHDDSNLRAFSIFENESANFYGENVGFGYTNVENLVEAWINSEAHKKNIEGDFTHTGVGTIANDKGVLYYTQIFFK